MKPKKDLVFLKIKSVLGFVWDNKYSSFYRDKYRKEGINPVRDINSWEDFEKLPFLTRKELVETDPYKRFFLPPEKIETFRISSGTTGGNKPLIMLKGPLSSSQKDLYSQKARGLEIKSWLFLYQPIVGLGRIIRESYLPYKGAVRILGDINNLPLTAKAAASLKIDAIQTTSTILYFFLPYLKREYSLDNIKYIALGGEFCSEQRLKFFKQQLGNAYFRFIFGSPETGWRAYRCKFLENHPPRFFHPLNSELYSEIINQVRDSELVATHLIKTDFPLIRYKTGDTVVTRDKKCPCGQKQIMEVFGKFGYDVYKIHGTLIYADLVYQALSPYLPRLASSEWQLHIFEEVIRDKIMPKLKLNLIPKQDNIALKKEIANGVSSRLYISSRHTLLDLVGQGVFLPLEVEFVDSFPLTTKQRRFVPHIV